MYTPLPTVEKFYRASIAPGGKSKDVAIEITSQPIGDYGPYSRIRDGLEGRFLSKSRSPAAKSTLYIPLGRNLSRRYRELVKKKLPYRNRYGQNSWKFATISLSGVGVIQKMEGKDSLVN